MTVSKGNPIFDIQMIGTHESTSGIGNSQFGGVFRFRLVRKSNEGRDGFLQWMKLFSKQ